MPLFDNKLIVSISNVELHCTEYSIGMVFYIDSILNEIFIKRCLLLATVCKHCYINRSLALSILFFVLLKLRICMWGSRETKQRASSSHDYVEYSCLFLWMMLTKANKKYLHVKDAWVK